MNMKPKSDRGNTLMPIKLSCETYNKIQNEEEALRKQRELEKRQELEAREKELEAKVSAAVDKHPGEVTNESKQCVDSSLEGLPDDEELPSSTSKAEGETLEKSKVITDKEQKDSSDSNNDWGDYAPYVTYEGDKAIYTDPSSQQKYTWNKEKSVWDADPAQNPTAGREYSYEDDTHVYTEADGSKFFWDVGKKAWIPKVDDDFLAFYQMSYGFVDNTSKAEEKEKDEQQSEQKKDKPMPGVKRKTDPQWFDATDENNTKVYVSNLPHDLTEEEFVALMQKCGLVERDPSNQKMKVKLYMDKEQNCFKGDALCTYIKIESVELALNLIDGSDFKGNKLKVERAHFQLKGEYNPALKPKKKKKKELEKIKKMQQKLFDWRPEKIIGERAKHEKVVIVKNLFHPTDFDQEVQLILDYQQDLREECSKAGEVRKVVLYDRHPEGVAQITMKEPEMADAAVLLINGRWFGKRQITAEIWDGKTKYKIAETDADIGKRIDKWDKFLEGKDDKTEKTETVTKPDNQDISESSAIASEPADKAPGTDSTESSNMETDPVAKSDDQEVTESTTATENPVVP